MSNYLYFCSILRGKKEDKSLEAHVLCFGIVHDEITHVVEIKKVVGDGMVVLSLQKKKILVMGRHEERYF